MSEFETELTLVICPTNRRQQECHFGTSNVRSYELCCFHLGLLECHGPDLTAIPLARVGACEFRNISKKYEGT